MRARAQRGRFDAPPPSRRGEPAVSSAPAAAASPSQGRGGTPGSVGANNEPWHPNSSRHWKPRRRGPLFSSGSAASLMRSGRRPCCLGARRLESTGGGDVAGARELCGFFPSSQPSSPLRAPTNPQNTQTHALNTHVHALKKKKKKSASDLRIPHTDRRRGPSTRSELPREQFQIGTEK